MILMTPTAAAAVSHRCLQLKLPFCAKEKWWLLKHACFEPPESLLMQATAGALPEDVQRLFQDVEDYLLAGLEKENLSARAREEGEAILVDIEQLKERYQWELQPRGVLPEFSSTRDASGDSLTWNVASEGSLPLGYPENRAENSCPKATQELGLVLKQGYLEKKSRDPKIFGSEWQKRWCVLTQTAFSYYANEKSKQPKGRFPIENYRARLASYLRKDARRGCCFELMCPGKRTYEFTASSPEEAKDWVDQILFLLQDMRSLVIPFEEDVKEETYDDIDSFESSHTMLLKNSSLNPEEEGETEEESREGIYEILPDEELGLMAPDTEGLEKTDFFMRSYADYYQGLWDCVGGHPDELSFQRGDLIYIISKDYSAYGWWVGELNSTVGIVPKEYLMPAYEAEDA
ncbi:src kinase-associated phosphoprotein 1 isoform X3 [Paroedura picta]|uniref:src kinase-associated phosphoprotein 1 isoform X3 n=1 Tax=Paroedura picta TaxID=143630 RepID=UPI0040576BA7